MIAAVAASGCMTVYEPIALGEGRYSVQARDSFSYGSSDALAASVAKANAFCAQKLPGSEAVVDQVTSAEGTDWSDASARVIFICRPSGKPADIQGAQKL